MEIFVDSYGDILPCCFITDKSVSNKILRNISFNVKNVPLHEVCNDWYLNKILEAVKDIPYCKRRCKVPIESTFIK